MAGLLAGALLFGTANVVMGLRMHNDDPHFKTRKTYEHRYNKSPTPTPTKEPDTGFNKSSAPPSGKGGAGYRAPPTPPAQAPRTPGAGAPQQEQPPTRSPGMGSPGANESTQEPTQEPTQAPKQAPKQAPTQAPKQQTAGKQQIPNPMGASAQGDYMGGDPAHNPVAGATNPEIVEFNRMRVGVSRDALVRSSHIDDFYGGDNVDLVKMAHASFLQDLNEYNTVYG